MSRKAYFLLKAYLIDYILWTRDHIRPVPSASVLVKEAIVSFSGSHEVVILFYKYHNHLDETRVQNVMTSLLSLANSSTAFTQSNYHDC